MQRENEPIWQKNVASGVVLRMAQTCENQGQWVEALLLYLQHFKVSGAFGTQAIHLFKALQRLQTALGEAKFRQIGQAVDFPTEALQSFMSLITISLTANPSSAPPSETFEVEQLPEPDAQFQAVWQDFYQSAQDKLTTEMASSTEELDTQFQPVQQAVQQIWQDFMNAAQTPPTSGPSSQLNFQQAWQNLEQTVQQLKEQYPQRQSLFDDDFEHLHLPSNSPISRPDWSQATRERELQEQQQAIRVRNPYAFFRQLKTLRSHSDSVYAVRFSPNGKFLASGSAEGIINLWDISSSQKISTLSGHTDAVTSLAMSPDGEVIASGGADAAIKLWHLSTCQERQTLIGHVSSVLSLAVSPDSQTLVSGSADRTIKLWNLSTGQLIQTLQGHNQSVLCVTLSPDGQTLASGSADSTIKLWNLSTAQEICTLNSEETRFVFAVAFHPDGQTLVSVDGNQKIKLWNLLSRKVFRVIPTAETVVSLAISPNGQTLAGACGSSLIKVIGMWDWESGKLVSFFDGYGSLVNHRGIVYEVTFSPDGKILASGGKDATIKLWGIPPPLRT